MNQPALDRLCMATAENLAQLVLAKGITSAEYVLSVKTKSEPLLSLTWSMDGQRAEL